MMKNLTGRMEITQRTFNHCIMGFATMVFSLSCSSGPLTRVNPQPTLTPPGVTLTLANDFFYANTGPVMVEVALDQIGVLAKEGVTDDTIVGFMGSLNLSLVTKFPGGLLIFGLADSLSRPELVDSTRQVELLGAILLQDAGIVIRTNAAAGSTPMIVTDEFIALFGPTVTIDQINVLNQANNVQIVSSDPFVTNQFLLKVTEASDVDALTMGNRYHEDSLTVFSHPNFSTAYALFHSIPNDPLFSNQWHLNNTGQGGGTPDADVDAPQAWDITMGVPNVVIAVIDNGCEFNQLDLSPNLAINAGETPGNNIDDDGNFFIDDINGWDFSGGFPGDNDPSPVGLGDNHGTALTGLAAAEGNNVLGVSGICPNCRFLPISIFSGCVTDQPACTANAWAISNAFVYAQIMQAKIILCGWGLNNPATDVGSPIILNAIQMAIANNVSVFFPGGNTSTDDWCTNPNSFSALPGVITVSSSTNQDEKATPTAFGDCIDILAPSHTGTLNMTTTDRTGNTGYNDFSPVLGCLDLANNDYTGCFGGTSAATAVAAGVAGLVHSANLSADPPLLPLSPIQVQRLLQDTADKIEPGVAAYDPNTGFSSPVGGSTHSWGRINAFEAVRIAGGVAQGGKSGFDIFLRDNSLDWGNTERPSNNLFETPPGFIPHWESPDIRVDAPDAIGNFRPAPANSAAFDTFTHENPKASVDNRVYVRVRNRGPRTVTLATPVTVKLHLAYAGAGMPLLPGDFWAVFPDNSSNIADWQPLACSTGDVTCTITNLPYSGSSVAGTAGDAAQIVQFDFTGPAVPAGLNLFAFLAIIDTPSEPISLTSKFTFIVDTLTPNDNNIAVRRFVVVP